jgi:hypothetical protein
MGALLVVGAIIAALASSGLGEQIGGQAETLICRIAGSGECGSGSQTAAAAIKPVPLMPAPPPLAEGDGGASGEWGRDDAGILDRGKKELAKRAADAAELRGWTNAARHLRHYLGNSGDPLEVDPLRLLRDIPLFASRAEGARLAMIKDLQDRARAAYNGEQVVLYEDGEGKWRSIPSDPAILGDDWFYAMGGFSYGYTARAIVRPPANGQGEPTIQIDYRLHVFDRYNWDKGKSVNIAGVTITDDVLGDLHRVGIAREYEIRGTTGVDSVTVGLNENVQQAPPAEPAPDRDGERDDPNRDRGRGGRGSRGGR